MTAEKSQIQLFNPIDLIPEEWKTADISSFYVFNPTLVRIAKDRFSMMYRVVTSHSEDRRLAVCHLDEILSVIPGSVVPFSDLITFENELDFDERALNWHADARYFSLGNRLFATWNDGSARPHNNQFMVELDKDGFTPLAPARLLQASRRRRNIEKNWMFFQTEMKNFCIYTTLPHDVMSVDLSGTEYVHCSPILETETSETYSKVFGEIRGGAQPIRLDDRFLCIAHSSYKIDGRKSWYACVAYEFAATAPFQILRISRKPIPLPGGEILKSTGTLKLNPDAESVVYPCGAVLDGKDILISYGINAESAAIARMPLSLITSDLQPVEKVRQVSMLSTDSSMAALTEAVEPRLAMYWWDSRGKSFDHELGTRKFHVGNFGDIASRDIVECIIAHPTRNSAEQYSPKLLAIGSILHMAGDGDVIWGSGAKGTKRVLPDRIKNLDVRAVRGPLTAEVLRSHEIDLSKLTHVFDPGCLIKHLWKNQLESYDVSRNDFRGPIRIVPHYRDDLSIRRLHPALADSILSVDDTPLSLAQKMLGAEVVVSSSLHGIIFAEALGIPAYWLRPLGGEDHFKYYDYYYGTGRYNVFPYETVTDALAAKPQPLPHFDLQAYLDTFPHDRIESLSTSGLSGGTTFSFVGRARSEIDDSFCVDWKNAIHRADGIHLKGEASTIGVSLKQQNWQPSVLRLTLGRNRDHLQAVRIAINTLGTESHSLEWAGGNFSDQTVEIYLPSNLAGHHVQIKLRAEDGLGLAEKVIVKTIALVPLTDFERSGFAASSVSAIESSTPESKSAKAIFDEFPTEWILRLESLHGIRGFSYKFGEKYARIRNTARLQLDSRIIAESQTLFLVGPYSPSVHTMSQVAMHVGDAVFTGDVQVDTIRNQWVAKIPIDGTRLAYSDMIELMFELIAECEGNTTIRRRGNTLSFRKCAFAKKRSHIDAA